MPNLNSSSNICCKIIENCEFILGATPTYVGPDDGEPNWTNDFSKSLIYQSIYKTYTCDICGKQDYSLKIHNEPYPCNPKRIAIGGYVFDVCSSCENKIKKVMLENMSLQNKINFREFLGEEEINDALHSEVNWNFNLQED